MSSPSTAVIILNWNGAEDSIVCMRSLLQMEDQDFFIVLCDNGSTDGSFITLKQWGESTLDQAFAVWTHGNQPASHARVVLIQTGDNLGFAGGCNVGIRYAMLHRSVQYLWLLNNDTVVDHFALGLQLEKMQSRTDIGILGSTLIFFDDPDRMQAPGGYGFNFWTARVLVPFPDLTPATLPPEATVEDRLAYVSGASMLVRKSFIQSIGLLNEQYFLYFEEVDWATRAKGSFALGYCAASRVLHKEGRSTGSHKRAVQRSSFSEAYLTRNRVLFLRTYFPYRLPICLVWLVAVGIARLLTGNIRLASALYRGVLRGLSAPILPLPGLNVWPASMNSVGAAPGLID